MKKLLFAGVALGVFVSGQAFAADLPARMPVKAPVVAPPVVFSWSGFYIGGHVGGGWGEKCFTFAGADEGCHDLDGFLGGGQIGFNWQAGQTVFGIEFSGSWGDLKGDHAILGFPDERYHTKSDTLLMLTGKLGLAWDRVMPYITGGGAWVRDRYRYVDAFGDTSTAREDRFGWTIGGGIEFALSPNWSLAAQYNYIALGEESNSFSGVAGNFETDIDQHLHVGTVRLNYRFGGPVVARY